MMIWDVIWEVKWDERRSPTGISESDIVTPRYLFFSDIQSHLEVLNLRQAFTYKYNNNSTFVSSIFGRYSGKFTLRCFKTHFF